MFVEGLGQGVVRLRPGMSAQRDELMLLESLEISRAEGDVMSFFVKKSSIPR